MILKRQRQNGLSRSLRRRLKAGFMLLLFGLLTMLPWFHTVQTEGHDGHCCCSNGAPGKTSAAPAVASMPPDPPEHHCWICDSLFSLSATSVSSTAEFHVALTTQYYVVHPAGAPILKGIYPSCRSQAPPVTASTVIS
jgi:hypothetical protein